MKLNDFIQGERNITDDFESSGDTHENYGKQGNFKLGIVVHIFEAWKNRHNPYSSDFRFNNYKFPCLIQGIFDSFLKIIFQT